MLLLILAFGLVGAGTASAQNKEVGAEKCGKMCHKVQFESWAKSKHGLDRAKGANCETCHGAGSAYMPMSVMKDPAKAKAAGEGGLREVPQGRGQGHRPAERARAQGQGLITPPRNGPAPRKRGGPVHPRHSLFTRPV
jgi:hypothetical protein